MKNNKNVGQERTGLPGNFWWQGSFYNYTNWNLFSKPDKPGFAGIGWFYGLGNVDGAPDLHGEIKLID